ncbi:MAG: hypothetical protein PHO00_08685 [bacterium]|nr:hypothetical protein [bacterium]
MNWEIEKRHKNCDVCGAEFKDGDICNTVFVYAEEEEAGERRDICGACWQKETPPFGKTIYWKGVFKVRPPEIKQEAIKKNSAENLLRKIMHSNDPAKINVSYILGLMLERKKVFIVIDNITEKETGKKFIVYENSKTGENFVITDPVITLDKINEVQSHVLELLDDPEYSDRPVDYQASDIEA